MLNRTTRSVEPPKEKSAAEKQAEEIEEAKEARAKFVRKGFYHFPKLTSEKLAQGATNNFRYSLGKTLPNEANW